MEVEIDGTWRRYMLTEFPKGNLKERGHLEDISTVEKILIQSVK